MHPDMHQLEESFWDPQHPPKISAMLRTTAPALKCLFQYHSHHFSMQNAIWVSSTTVVSTHLCMCSWHKIFSAHPKAGLQISKNGRLGEEARRLSASWPSAGRAERLRDSTWVMLNTRMGLESKTLQLQTSLRIFIIRNKNLWARALAEQAQADAEC